MRKLRLIFYIIVWLIAVSLIDYYWINWIYIDNIGFGLSLGQYIFRNIIELFLFILGWVACNLWSKR